MLLFFSCAAMIAIRHVLRLKACVNGNRTQFPAFYNFILWPDLDEATSCPISRMDTLSHHFPTPIRPQNIDAYLHTLSA
jgi:hypothetical protein